MQPSAGDPIRDYIRANLAIHTQDAIRAALIAAGHDPVRVDAIWQVEWQSFALERSVGNFRALTLSLYVVGGLLGALGALAIVGINEGQSSSSAFVLLYAVGYLAIGYAISRLVRWGVRRFRLGGWRTFVLGAALFPVYLTLMFGGCFATLWVAQVVL